MATKTELAAEIAEITGAEVNADDHKHDELEAMLADAKATADVTAGYTVAAGKAITTKRGILADGAKIEERDLAGGDDAIAAFVKSGHIVKNG